MFDFKEAKITSSVSIFDALVEKRNYEIAGVLVNRAYGFYIPFEGIGQMFSILDRLFDFVGFPMANMRERSFVEEKVKWKHQLPDEVYGLAESGETFEKPNFVLHVQFRRGTTWQGTLSWAGRDLTRQFRSEQELLRLMLSALDREEETKGEES